MQVLVDRNLSRRLERAEARASAEFVTAHAQLEPALGAEWIEVAGVHALFDGASSPVTQTFGLGILQQATEADLDRLEAFFRDRGAPVLHEVSPLADKSLWPLLSCRGYRPLEFTSVLYLPLSESVPVIGPRNPRIRVRLADIEEQELWAATSAEGWQTSPESADLIAPITRISAAKADALNFFAELDERPIATGSLSLQEGVAVLAGASTIPDARGQGAQLALLESRLRYAVGAGCDLAMMGAEPGSASQRNAERQGFRIAYTRLKWELKGP